MTTKTLTITDFLLARIAEDHKEAHRALRMGVTGARRLEAEYEAKRRIVEQVSDTKWGGFAVKYVILGHLASVYSDHPDFDEAWRI